MKELNSIEEKRLIGQKKFCDLHGVGYPMGSIILLASAENLYVMPITTVFSEDKVKCTIASGTLTTK